jgi:hypothetical protein
MTGIYKNASQARFWLNAHIVDARRQMKKIVELQEKGVKGLRIKNLKKDLEFSKKSIVCAQKELKELATREEENRKYQEKKMKEVIKQKDVLKVKYYLWDWCMGYGWRQTGFTEGYNSLKELKKDQEFTFKNSDNWKILKAVVVESKIK